MDPDALVLSLISSLKEYQNIDPLLYVPYLHFIQSIEEHFGPFSSSSHLKINSFFSFCLKIAFDNNLFKKFDFIIKERSTFFPESDFLPDIHQPKNPSKMELKKYFFKEEEDEEEKEMDKIADEEESKIAVQNSISSNFFLLYFKHANILIHLKKYYEAIQWFYYFLNFEENKNNKKEIQQKINFCERQILLHYKDSLPYKIFKEIEEDNEKFPFPAYSQDCKEMAEKIEIFLKAGNIFLNTKKWNQGIFILQSLLSFIQGLKKYLKKRNNLFFKEIEKIELFVFQKICFVHEKKFNFDQIKKFKNSILF